MRSGIKPLVLVLLGRLSVPGPAGIRVCEPLCGLSHGDRNKPLFIPNEAPNTDQTVPLKFSLANQAVYWGYLQEHEGGVPCGNMGDLKAKACPAGREWQTIQQSWTPRALWVISRKIPRGAPPVPLFISAFATSDWTHVSPVAFESLESRESCSSLQEGPFQFRENNYAKPMGAVMFGQWWLVGPGAQGRYQPSPARQGDGRRWQRKLEIQLLMKLHQLVQSEASGNRKRSSEGHRARAR